MKLKTKKSLVKKFKVTKNKKVTRRKTGQNHYNSKNTGAEGQRKRGDFRLFKADEQNVLKGMPYIAK